MYNIVINKISIGVLINNKNILLMDDSERTIQYLKILIDDYTNFKLTVELNYNKIIDAYTDDKYEYIIIEHTCKNSDELINYICTNNAKQKIILLSDSINCPIECASCMDSLRFVRLLKPINFKLILEYLNPLNEFQCENQFRFDSIDTIERLFDFINLEENSYYTKKHITGEKLVISSTSYQTIKIKEFEAIKNNINDKYFNYNILENSIILSNKNPN